AILAGLLLPALTKAKERAKSIKCLGNARQISYAGLMYGDDYSRHVTFSGGIDRKTLLYPYLQQGRSNADVSGLQVWNCPANQQPTNAAGYGFNTLLNNVIMTTIANPTETVDVADAGINAPGVFILSTHLMPPSTVQNASLGRPNPRHLNGRGVNIGFVDGHAAATLIEPPFYPGRRSSSRLSIPACPACGSGTESPILPTPTTRTNGSTRIESSRPQRIGNPNPYEDPPLDRRHGGAVSGGARGGALLVRFRWRIRRVVF
ncbi:MAG: hypothetical protein FJ398_24975, partial [Verrucomicrobia bacterium]|nr:hypothetical protein [Verrucomicrobiota bacterium]